MFGETEVIYSYTREQAIEDGVLVDVTETAREAGFKINVVITGPLWATINDIPAYAVGQDVEGRLWDVLWMASVGARNNKNESYFHFPVYMAVYGAVREIELFCEVHPGDNGEAVCTIGYPEDR